MPGITGNAGLSGALSAMESTIQHEEWYEIDRFEERDGELSLTHHGAKDPGGWTVWEGNDGVGVVYGTVSNMERLGLDTDDLFQALLDRPSVVLPKLSGPFSLAVLDRRDDSVTLATDKHGTRSLYYAETDDGFLFSSEIKALIPELEGPELNPDAVGDLVAFGYVLGEKTLVREVQSLQAATMARFSDGELDVTRYWEPECGRVPTDGYIDRAMGAYRRTIADIAGTLDDRVGIFLSGGLDSRLLASVLRDEYGPMTTITYDSNPADGSNIKPARSVANYLGVENNLVELQPGDYADDIEKVVELTDGMTSWSFVVNLDFILHELHDRVDVVMEGATQGELFGEQIWTYHMMECSDATEALYQSFPHLSNERVNELVTPYVEPKRSIAEEVAKSNKTEQEHQVMDVWLRNFNSNSHYRNKKVLRSQTGVRIPFASGELLNTVAKMPHERYRRDSFPFTRGTIPRSMAPLKRDLVNRLDKPLADIPYERTRLGSSRPMWMHDMAYVTKQLYWKFVTGRQDGNLGDWSRNDPKTRETLQKWLDKAADRDVFDTEAVEALSREHFSGEANHLQIIAPITGVELWAQKYLDGKKVTPAAKITKD